MASCALPMNRTIKIIRTATVPESLDVLLKGQLSFLNQYYQVLAVSGPGAHLQNVEGREGVMVCPVEMERRIAPWQDLKSLYRLYRCFKRERPSIVHSITPKAGLLSMMAAKLAGVPIRMHTFTGLIFPSKTGLFQRLLITMDKMLCRCATHIIPEGEGVKADLQRFRITNKPMQVIANGNVNGIDLDYFNKDRITITSREQLKQELGIEANDYVFIFVGRLVRDKGINELVQVFDTLSAEDPRVKLLLVGPAEPELDPLLPETVQRIAQNRNIITVGLQKDVRPYFAISQALVFPSYREGFPNVVLQAGAMELPSIVSNINGCNEIIQEGVNGVIIPSKDGEALLQAMKMFLSRREEISAWSRQAREVIERKYSREVVWEATKALYDQKLADLD